MSDDPTDHDRGAEMLDEFRDWSVPPESAAESKLRELTALLCTEEGQDVVERAKTLIETESGSARLSEARRAGKRHIVEHEGLERLVADAKRSGYVAAIGALHNAMPQGFVETDTDKVIGRVAAALAEKDAAYKELDEKYTFSLRDETETLDRKDAELTELRAELAALRLGEPEAVSYMRMQRDVFCDKLNEYIDKTKEAEQESDKLRAQVAELEGPRLLSYCYDSVTPGGCAGELRLYGELTLCEAHASKHEEISRALDVAQRQVRHVVKRESKADKW